MNEQFIWSVPISSTQHVAHLISTKSHAGVTYRLCLPYRLIAQVFAIVVDSEHYQLKCKECARRSKDVVIGKMRRPRLITAAQVVEARADR